MFCKNNNVLDFVRNRILNYIAKISKAMKKPFGKCTGVYVLYFFFLCVDSKGNHVKYAGRYYIIYIFSNDRHQICIIVIIANETNCLQYSMALSGNCSRSRSISRLAVTGSMLLTNRFIQSVAAAFNPSDEIIEVSVANVINCTEKYMLNI